MSASVLPDPRFSLTIPLVPANDTTNDHSTRSPEDEAQWERLLNELLRLGKLEHDWDGQGAEAVAGTNVDRAVHWVKEMRRWQRALPPSRVLPGTTGEVILEWRAPSFYLAAEISTPAQLDWLLDLPGQPLQQWQTDARGPWIVLAEN
jgi:hypothetical protein